MPRARCFGLRGAPFGGSHQDSGRDTRASPLPRVAPNWTRPTGREPVVLSSRYAGHGGISRRKECRDELSAIPQRTPSSERLTPTTVVACAASRDVWREARPRGRRTAARNLRNSPPRNVTLSSPGRSCHETSWMVNRIQTTQPRDPCALLTEGGHRKVRRTGSTAPVHAIAMQQFKGCSGAM
jgi:hypothetical protein